MLAGEERQQGFLCDDVCSDKPPRISYKPATSPGGDKRINKAFDLLFQEVMNIRKSKNTHETNGHIRPGFDRPAGGRTND